MQTSHQYQFLDTCFLVNYKKDPKRWLILTYSAVVLSIVQVQIMLRPDPFNSPKKIKTEPILRDKMGNGKRFMVLYSMKVYPQPPWVDFMCFNWTLGFKGYGNYRYVIPNNIYRKWIIACNELNLIISTLNDILNLRKCDK